MRKSPTLGGGPAVSAAPAAFEMMSSQLHPTTAAPQHGALSAAEAEEMMEKIETLEAQDQRQQSSYLSLQQQVLKLENNHDHHVDTTRGVFTQVTQLLGATNSLAEKVKGFEANIFMNVQQSLAANREEWLDAARNQNTEFEEQVKRVLGNFRNEIVSVSRENENRYNEVMRALNETNDRLARNAETQETIKQDHQRLMGSLGDVKQQVTGFVDSTNRQLDCSKEETRSLAVAQQQLKDEIQRGHENQQNAVTLSREEASRQVKEVRDYTEALLTETLEGFSADLSKKMLQDQEEGLAFTRTVEAAADELSRRQGEDRAAASGKYDELLIKIGHLEGETSCCKMLGEKLEAALDQRVDTSVSKVVISIERQGDKIAELDRVLQTTQSAIAAVTTQYNDEKEHIQVLAERVNSRMDETLTTVQQRIAAHTESQQTQVRSELTRVEQEVERRHRKLVESTHTAMQEVIRDTESAPKTQIAELRRQFEAFRETQTSQTQAIEALRIDGSLETAFAEIKDWLQDIERRMMTRAAVEESLINVNSQLSALKNQTQQSEAQLAQRLDAERVAREHEYAQTTGQLQKLQLARR